MTFTEIKQFILAFDEMRAILWNSSHLLLKLRISATGSYTKYTTSVLFNINLIYRRAYIFFSKFKPWGILRGNIYYKI